MRRIGFIRALIVLPLLALPLHARGDDFPKYNNLRFEEDWSAFDPASTEHRIFKAKHVALSDRVWLSTGGKLRLRAEGWNNFNFDQDNDEFFLLYRLHFHTDWHFGEHFRVFLEGRYTGLTERDLPGGKRPALDVDRGDLWNAFLEGRFDVRDVDVTLRVGRQELQFGRQRLVSPLDWANNRRIFDAALLRLRGGEGRWSVTAFSSMPVNVRDDWFTWNKTDDSLLFSGAYYTQRLGETKHHLEAYAFAQNPLDDQPIEERRYTVGGQVYGPIVGDLAYNVEGAYQFGRRTLAGEYRDTRESIRAWMLTAESTYTFSETRGKPWITIGADYASGDRSADDSRAQTFRQIYPLGHAYFGYIDAIGRQNIIDARASVGVWPVKDKLRVQADLHWLWLASRHDALYNVGGGVGRGPIITTEGGRVINTGKRGVGQELDLSFNYFLNRHIAFHGGYSRFFAGDFLKATGAGRDIDFAYTQVEFTF